MSTTFTRGENPLRADKLNTALDERVSVSGDTMTGPLTLWQDPSGPFDAATKQYVDSRIQLNAPSGSTTIPAMDGVGAVGVGGTWARADHVHPTDTGASHNVGRNLLHNSLFNVAQRGIGGFVAQGYTLDRWVAITTLDTIGYGQVAIGDTGRTQIGDEEAANCLSNAFVGNTGASASNNITQRIESVRRLAGKTVTVSFWAQCTTGQKLGVSLDQWFGTGGAPSAAVSGVGQATSALTATWTRCSFQFALPSIAGKTFGTNNDNYTALNIWYSSGTTNATRAGSIGVQSGTINIWGVQLEVGSVATPLEKPDPQQDLAKCQRFYQTGILQLYGYGAAGQTVAVATTMPVPMRVSPTVVPTITSTSNATGTTIGNVGAQQVNIFGTITAAGAFQLQGSFTASADL